MLCPSLLTVEIPEKEWCRSVVTAFRFFTCSVSPRELVMGPYYNSLDYVINKLMYWLFKLYDYNIYLG
jgi:hypothetical protein